MVSSSVSSGVQGGNVAEYTVSELSFKLKRTVEDTFSYVRVRGELGRISRPGSGHIYLDLKDEKSVLAGVVWRGQAEKLKIQPEQGLEVVVTGRLTTYPGQSKYQIVIDAMEPAGIGALMALLEERKKKLAAEGLFDEDRKKPLPFLPRIIGIITSPTGAVIRDMMHGFEERFPSHVIVWPVRVQGETCGNEVAAAIRGFNELDETSGVPKPELLIVARGGGSFEDLWGFNDEIVVRAASESQIPLISAVGHETDWTLIDLVADARAPTPTKAAEWAVPKYSDLVERTGEFAARLGINMHRSLERRRSELTAAGRGLPRLQDIIALPRQRFDSASGRLSQALHANSQAHRTRFVVFANRFVPALRQSIQSHRMAFNHWNSRLSPTTIQHRIGTAKQTLDNLGLRARRTMRNAIEGHHYRLEGQTKLLTSLGYKNVLARGYALVRDGKGDMVRTTAQVGPGQHLEIEFADGHVKAEAFKINTEEKVQDHGSVNIKAKVAGDAHEKSKKRGKQMRAPGKKDEQGSLF